MYQHYPNTFSIKQRRKNVDLFPEFFAHNIDIRLLANHLLGLLVSNFNFVSL